jgi:hypothetical protein
MPRCSEVYFIDPFHRLLRSKWALPTASVIALLLVLPADFVTRFSLPYFDMPVVADDFALRDTPDDQLPHDPNYIGPAKPQVHPVELKQEPSVPTTPEQESPRTATELPQRETEPEMNGNGQQPLNLRRK